MKSAGPGRGVSSCFPGMASNGSGTTNGGGKVASTALAPSFSRAWPTPSMLPSASPSGLTWQTSRMRSAAATAVRMAPTATAHCSSEIPTVSGTVRGGRLLFVLLCRVGLVLHPVGLRLPGVLGAFGEALHLLIALARLGQQVVDVLHVLLHVVEDERQRRRVAKAQGPSDGAPQHALGAVER